ncbi:GlxA family transcriptional regulator [Brevibacterium spongiae]|uniref:Helix-turn-helix domain-containing protein n=1 Tax=Brevibacterium spongiae TaxID=2909672 RepID=A0ABY5SS18_9MICO|nr:helix-turn-helix domain-containing protein [Brevibacterium spongiae]UVI36989.1 helix-turn-helix domain-containing protein [Brevibacterium spongiae]
MHTVGLALHRDSMLFETAIAAEVFGTDRSELSPRGEWYDLIVCTPSGEGADWLPQGRSGGFAALLDADSIVVPSTTVLDGEPEPELLEVLREAAEKRIRIAGLCTGSFVLAAAGLLDGRPATTHWMHTAELSRLHPAVDVRDNVLYVDDGAILTSAGKTAALDLCLHLVRLDHGAAAANALARSLVVASHRPGGQKQFVISPADPVIDDSLGAALDWARGHLDEPLTVDDLARRAAVSSRQLARRMLAEVGVAPLRWLHNQRILRAQDLLERTDAAVEIIAARCGMGTAATLRRHFRNELGVSPTAYRNAFLRPEAPPISR